MLIQLLFTSTTHFVLAICTAFVFFAAGLLYFDSWRVDTGKRTPLLRAIGFFLLAFGAAIHASAIDIPTLIFTIQIARISGLFLILGSLVSEPLLHFPRRTTTHLGLPLVLPVLSSSLIPLSIVLLFLIALTYYRKATEGFEKQLRPASSAFFFFGLSEIVRLFMIWSTTPIIFWSQMLAPFGPFWALYHILEFVGVCILARWVWGYVRFRLQIQLFVSTIALSLVLFLTTTILYTFLLLHSLENNMLSHLTTDVNVLHYSLESVSSRTLAQAQTLAQDKRILDALIQSDKKTLSELTSEYMIAQGTDTVVIASASGMVILRSDDTDRTNDTVGNDPLLISALAGKPLTTVFHDEGITVPYVSLRAAAPIQHAGVTIGAVLTGVTIDSAFVDGVKTVTGLDTTVFGKDRRAATTFIAADGKSRFVGTFEADPIILDTVLTKGETYVGSAKVLNLPFYTAYAPLKNSDGAIVGMLFVGKPQTTLIDTAKKSITLTLLGSMILILLSLIPTYFFSRFLKDQQ